ncbi:MAG: aldehyde dehydrogenase family protein [Planctomycetota bacterium]|nr:aldehyde dehydrogenase family protein [Planctomycetota bacterium]
MNVLNPYSGELVCSIEETTDTELQQRLTQAGEALRTWRRTSVEERVARLRAGIQYFREDRESIALEITQQMGKPLAQARGEVDAMIDRAEHMLEIAPAVLAPDLLEPKPGFHRRIEHEPLGVVFNLAAWNYPLLIAVNVVVPALLAGNVVLLKHSSKTPLCGDRFAKAFPHVSHLVLDHERTAALIRSGEVDHVAFTGSVEGGREVFQQAASGPKFLDTGLELGGADPAYVAADADLDVAVAAIVDGACYNAGQSCCAVERVYVHQDHYQEFLERAQLELRNYQLGDPQDESTTMGPMASRSAVGFLRSQVEDAIKRGSKLLEGGDAAGESGQFFTPTLLADCPNDCEVMQEESFGPVLPVASVANDEEAIARMNDSRFGLTASVWTPDRERAERFAAELKTGTVFQNRCDFLDPDLPWTGVGDSGKGSTLSRYGLLCLTRRKSLHFKD